MPIKNDFNNDRQDFLDFLNAPSVDAPQNLTNSVVGVIEADLNPSSWIVFSKISGIHFIVGFVTLSFCPQFGISITSQMGLMEIFMQFGHEVCMLGCGFVFLGSSSFVAGFSLSPFEIKVLKQNIFLQFAMLSTLSVGFFVALGAEIIFTLGSVWLLGAIIGGLLSLNMSWNFRKFLHERLWI